MTKGKKWSVFGGQQPVKDKSSMPHDALSSQPTAHRPQTTVLIIGHRGAAAVAPENTIVSFERSLSDGADGIEFDVRLARDGVPVVIHDSTLRRTALRPGEIAGLSSTELSEMDAGTWFNLRHPAKAQPLYTQARIPTLAAVFEFLGESNARLYVEMKCGPRDRAALAMEVANLIRAHAVSQRVVVESFDLAAIAEIKRIDAGLRTAALFDRRLSRPAPSAKRLPCIIASPLAALCWKQRGEALKR
jgi:glycerophosphoryl diester phosphodiesterase